MNYICKKNDRCKTLIKIIISLFLAYLLIVNVDWQEVWEYIIQANIYFILSYLIFYFLGLMISARKWQVLAKFKKFTNTYFFYFKTYLLGTFLNNFFPSFVGGDAYRIYALGKSKGKISESSTTIVADRVSGLVGIMILSVFFTFINKAVLLDQKIIIFINLALIAAIIVFIVVFSKKKFVQFFVKILPKFVQEYINKLMVFRNSDIAIKTLLYSFLFAIVGVGITNFILFEAIGVSLSIIDYISVVFLSSIIAAAPISVGNVGVKEWAYVFLFGIFGVSASAAVTVVLMSRVLQMIVSFIAIPFYIQNKKTLQHK